MEKDDALCEKLKEEVFSMIEKTMDLDQITQAEVARRLGARRTNINMLMRKKLPVSLDFLLKVASCLGLEADIKIWKKSQEKPHKTASKAAGQSRKTRT
jgi:predicted XRE-type DNA-binding protein